MLSLAEKIKALRIICGVGIIDSRQAIEYCESHPDCNEVGYLMSKSFAVNMKCSKDERIRHFSEYAKNHTCYKKWIRFLETGKITD